MDLLLAAQDAVSDSKRWFPETAGNPFFTASCLAGEAGEVINELKKYARDPKNVDKIEVLAKAREEVVDVFTYLLKLAGELGMDLEAEYYHKREYNELRFGKQGTISNNGYQMPMPFEPVKKDLTDDQVDAVRYDVARTTKKPMRGAEDGADEYA
jgi:NTP pyrophosphatase (non-canonical NTP hydrolase)